jgi:hypothetical protein
MEVSGNILKMQTSLADVVDYKLPIGDHLVPMNPLIGQKISLHYEGQINCIKCGRRTKTSFQQGFCYSCFQTAPEADPAIIRPELDLAHEGISRDMEWAKKYSLTEHVVYLAISSGLKVGVTRASQYTTRWMDQGAVSAILLAKTPYRQLAGLIEVELKDHFADKTNWRNMLSNRIQEGIDLENEKNKAADLLSHELQQYVSEEDCLTSIDYPVIQYPQKIKSINLDKQGDFKGVLTGIKGQYLMFDYSHVINIRKYGGYHLDIEY